MFDINQFKKSVKQWIKQNPEGDIQALIDHCEELIPPQQFSANQWLVDQTVSWFQHIQAQKEANQEWLLD